MRIYQFLILHFFANIIRSNCSPFETKKLIDNSNFFFLTDVSTSGLSHQRGSNQLILGGTGSALTVSTTAYLNIIIGASPILIHKIITQGESSATDYVEEFEMSYTLDGSTFIPYSYYGSNRIPGNYPSSDWMVNVLEEPLRTSGIRIRALNCSGACKLRLEIIYSDVCWI